MKSISISNLKNAKQYGFSDEQISILSGISESSIYKKRLKNNILPSIKQIDTVAAEYPAETNYLYLTYNGDKDDLKIQLPKKCDYTWFRKL